MLRGTGWLPHDSQLRLGLLLCKRGRRDDGGLKM